MFNDLGLRFIVLYHVFTFHTTLKQAYCHDTFLHAGLSYSGACQVASCG